MSLYSRAREGGVYTNVSFFGHSSYTNGLFFTFFTFCHCTNFETDIIFSFFNCNQFFFYPIRFFQNVSREAELVQMRTTAQIAVLGKRRNGSVRLCAIFVFVSCIFFAVLLYFVLFYDLAVFFSCVDVRPWPQKL